MKVQENKQRSKEQTILTALITNQGVLAAVAARWDKELFSSQYSNTIASWCIRHFEKYGEPPRRSITAYFREWAENRKEDGIAKEIDKVLGRMSEDWEKTEEDINAGFMIDTAAKYFNEIRIRRVCEEAIADLEIGQSKKAEEKISSFNRINMADADESSPITDTSQVVAALGDEDEQETLVEYHGAIGQLLQDDMSRDNFVAFMAPEKTGKTWWLLDVAYRAMLQRRKVAFFEVGDMSKRQFMTRLYTRVVSHPSRSPEGRWPYTVSVPKEIKVMKNGAVMSPKVTMNETTFDKKLTIKNTTASLDELLQKKIKTKSDPFKLWVYPAGTVTVAAIRAELQKLDRVGWSADVICVDYADILADPAKYREKRDCINQNWIMLRSLAMERHCLLVTATQADAQSYDGKLLSRKNFSEDKRKLSHATSVIGINVTGEEKEQQIARLNVVVRREGDFSSRRCVFTAQCLPLGNPCVKSCW